MKNLRQLLMHNDVYGMGQGFGSWELGAGSYLGARVLDAV